MTASKKIPRIGLICSDNDETPASASYRNQIHARYVQSVVNAGGLPLLIPLQFPLDSIPRLVSFFDGILIIGGNDVAIDRYGGIAHPSVSAPNPERDTLEIAISRMALTQRLPLFGICRGEQVMNVAAGGTLYSDIPSQFETALRHNQPDEVPIAKLTQRVRVLPDSQLFAIVQTERLWTNTFHHQAVDALGDGFRAAAFGSDGLIEAIEYPDHPFAIGVQWHPEGLQDHPEHAALFRAFVAAAQAGDETKSERSSRGETA